MKKNSIIEVYPAIQSEGSRAGMPTIVVRTTGCTHRCYFGEGGWGDTWYTSIHPEKGTLGLDDVIKAYKENPQITEMMITGGSPTMHPKLISELTQLANGALHTKIFTTIETEGSHLLKLCFLLIWCHLALSSVTLFLWWVLLRPVGKLWIKSLWILITASDLIRGRLKK